MRSLIRLVLFAMVFAPVASAQSGAPSVTVGGTVFGQYLYQLKDSLGAGHQNQFSIQRAYINVLGRFTGGLAARLTTDIVPTGTGNQQVRLKFAYAAWRPANSSLTYRFGLIHTPYLDWEEALWDYRMQGPIAMDRNGYLTSADFGFGIDGRWNDERVNMQVALVNGEGYSGGTGDSRKDVMGRVSVRLSETDDPSRVGGLRVTGYAGIGKATGGAVRNRLLGIVSYRTQHVALAGELASTKDGAINGTVISTFAVYRFPESQAAAIGRVDVVDPNRDTPNDRQTRVIAGISYQMHPNLRVLGDVDLLSFEGGATALQDATRQRALFQMQLTF